ncbi:uncharacterized protein Eint_050560 [Encephalitozoon intestinalis ATCC 50506]|uniref:Uncharacterized protein n=1 Tax=Encephalitozoon intestinalis (strain ATCC 50506) TaxID=876142 RepID=E0S777_ENCIT|nr:uncharacterized protein Eint_050560 [Encephalitozoon intestinalis ATCC 50506]ADM11505.1 hypothetical protein Eint_050560 [Encephalitozoon intestinalis ATCC 50506]UTX45218.1 WD40 domain-containing protein [Encephalitozoon intestinalis]
MDTVLVKLVDRNHDGAEHNPLHVSTSFTTEDLERYLRSVLGGDGGYRFYIAGRGFEGSLLKEISSRALEVEEGLTIEYELDRNYTPDVLIELEDLVSCLTVVKSRQPEVWCGTHGGRLKIYAYQDGVINLMKTTDYSRVRGVSREDGLYIYNSAGEVVEFESGDVLFKVDGDITCIASSSNVVSVGTHEGECYVFKEGLMKVHKFKAYISSTAMNKDEAMFVCADGNIGVFGISTNTFKTKDLGYGVTSSDMGDGKYVFGTSCSGLVVENKEESTFVSTGIRFSNRIAMYNGCIVAQASQYTISVVDIGDHRELRRITVDECISDIGWIENLLIAGVGSRIHGYIIHNLE